MFVRIMMLLLIYCILRTEAGILHVSCIRQSPNTSPTTSQDVSPQGIQQPHEHTLSPNESGGLKNEAGAYMIDYALDS